MNEVPIPTVETSAPTSIDVTPFPTLEFEIIKYISVVIPRGPALIDSPL